MVFASGTRLGSYEILSSLGSGGMGEVYRAKDPKLEREIAIKVLPPEMATGERRMRFEREAKAVASLDHPNIVTIYSVEEADGVSFYTMQLVKGKTLTELIPKKGLALNQFFELAIPLADAVSAAHQKGIIHRDLKPDNLMPWCTTRDLGPQLSFTHGFEVPHEHFQTHSAEVCEEGLSREELA